MHAHLKNEFTEDEKCHNFMSWLNYLTHLCLTSQSGTYANSADPNQMPQNVVSDQGLHSLLTGISIKNKIEMK